MRSPGSPTRAAEAADRASRKRLARHWEQDSLEHLLALLADVCRLQPSAAPKFWARLCNETEIP